MEIAVSTCANCVQHFSSYRVGGTKAFLSKMLSYQTQLSNYFPSDGDHFMDNYIYFIFMSAILWITICILFHERNYLDLDTICFIS